MDSKNIAIIPAAGQGKRMQSSENKQFLTLQGMPIIVHTLRVFEACHAVQEVILVVSEGELERFEELVSEQGFQKVTKIILGGKERQESVYNGFCQVGRDADVVLVHDGARPLITEPIINEVINAAKLEGAAVVAVPVKDTIKQVYNQQVVKTLEREYLWQAQTPQAFRYDIFSEALRQAKMDDFAGTDDTSLVERLGRPVKIVMGSYENLKITTREDLILAKAILDRRTNL